MSPPPASRASPAGRRTDASTDRRPATDRLLASLDAEYAREILEAIRTDPKPARELAAECDASRATVYRRLNDLEEAGLVASWTVHDPDGHHRTVFEATFESVTVDLGVDGLSVSVATEPLERATGPPGPEP